MTREVAPPARNNAQAAVLVSGTGTTAHLGFGLMGRSAGCAQIPLLHDTLQASLRRGRAWSGIKVPPLEARIYWVLEYCFRIHRQRLSRHNLARRQPTRIARDICRYVDKAKKVIRFIGVMALLLLGLAFLIGLARTPKHKPAPKAAHVAHIAAEWPRPAP
jgi:hypothetical protein